jgi:hypothetical protein
VELAAVACERICIPLGINPPLYPRRLEFFTMDRSFSIEKARVTWLGESDAEGFVERLPGAASEMI